MADPVIVEFGTPVLMDCPNCSGKFTLLTGYSSFCWGCEKNYCDPCGRLLTHDEFRGHYKQPGNTCADCRDIKNCKNSRRNSQELTATARFEILKRDNFTCQYCGRSAPEVKLQVDHILAVAKGGTNQDSNLITACNDCNRGKSDSNLN